MGRRQSLCRGRFYYCGGYPANHIAKWDGSSWAALGSGVSYSVGALVWDGSNLYAGGGFTTAGGNPVNYIAKWDGNSWSALGSSIDGDYVYAEALAWDGNSLYVGGRFTIAGGKPSHDIARWRKDITIACGYLPVVTMP